MKRIRKIILISPVVAIMVACGVLAPVSINTATSSSLTTTTLSPTVTMVVNTPSFTPTFTPTTTFTPTPIPTDLPTLSPEEAQATVLRLLSQSDTCKLPCWWGVIPGKTRWEEVYPFFKQFASKITRTEQGEWTGFGVYTSVPKSVQQRGRLAQGFRVENGVVTLISAAPGPKEFTLRSVFKFFPNTVPQIYIRTYSEARESLPFYMILFYPEQGVMVRYHVDATIKSDVVTGCFNVFSNSENPHSGVWIQVPNLSFAEFTNGNILGADESKLLKPLDSVSESTSGKIYELVNRNADQICIETSASLWPHP